MSGDLAPSGRHYGPYAPPIEATFVDTPPEPTLHDIDQRMGAVEGATLEMAGRVGDLTDTVESVGDTAMTAAVQAGLARDSADRTHAAVDAMGPRFDHIGRRVADAHAAVDRVDRRVDHGVGYLDGKIDAVHGDVAAMSAVVGRVAHHLRIGSPPPPGRVLDWYTLGTDTRRFREVMHIRGATRGGSGNGEGNDTTTIRARVGRGRLQVMLPNRTEIDAMGRPTGRVINQNNIAPSAYRVAYDHDAGTLGFQFIPGMALVDRQARARGAIIPGSNTIGRVEGLFSPARLGEPRRRGRETRAAYRRRQELSIGLPMPVRRPRESRAEWRARRDHTYRVLDLSGDVPDRHNDRMNRRWGHGFWWRRGDNIRRMASLGLSLVAWRGRRGPTPLGIPIGELIPFHDRIPGLRGFRGMRATRHGGHTVRRTDPLYR